MFVQAPLPRTLQAEGNRVSGEHQDLLGSFETATDELELECSTAQQSEIGLRTRSAILMP